VAAQFDLFGEKSIARGAIGRALTWEMSGVGGGQLLGGCKVLVSGMGIPD